MSHSDEEDFPSAKRPCLDGSCLDGQNDGKNFPELTAEDVFGLPQPVVLKAQMTLFTSKLTHIIAECCMIPHCEYMVICFSEEGAGFYCSPSDHNAIVDAFLHRSTFTHYELKNQKRIQYVFSKAKMDHFHKQISKGIESIEFNVAENGLTVSGVKVNKTGTSNDFTIPLPCVAEEVKVFELYQLVWKWQIRTSSEDLASNLNFIEHEKYVRLSVKAKKLSIEAVEESGTICTGVSQDLESHLAQNFEVMLIREYMKLLISAAPFEKSVAINFNMPNDGTFLLFFKYIIEAGSNPESHCSIYINPCRI